MKIAVRYQSKGGNTKAVAEKIAELTGVKAEAIGTALNEPVDILFIGGAIYAFGMEGTLKNYLRDLDPAMVKSAVAFSTGMKMSVAGKISNTLRKKGIVVSENTLSITGMKAGVLTDDNLRQIDTFVKTAL
jgi:flavodoxin